MDVMKIAVVLLSGITVDGMAWHGLVNGKVKGLEGKGSGLLSIR